jgi:hypothetical protein
VRRKRTTRRIATAGESDVEDRSIVPTNTEADLRDGFVDVKCIDVLLYVWTLPHDMIYYRCNGTAMPSFTGTKYESVSDLNGMQVISSGWQMDQLPAALSRFTTKGSKGVYIELSDFKI